MAYIGNNRQHAFQSKTIKPSIAFMVPTLGTHGGSVRVALLLANHFAQQGHRVLIISKNNYEHVHFPLHEAISCETLGFEGGRLRQIVFDSRVPLKGLLSQYHIDIAFGIGTYETLMLLMPAHQRGVPVIFCDHGALINQWNDTKMRLIRWLNLCWSHKTVVLTQQSKRDYEQLLHAKPNKVITIPNWIPADMCAAGNEHHYTSSNKRLLWCGRLSPEKGVDLLLDIAERVLPKYPDWHWDVVGNAIDDAYLAKVTEDIAKRNLQNQLHLCGAKSNMLDVYPQYAAVTLTSYREGLPLTLLEGLAFHLPLISFDVNTGPSDIICHSKNGWLIDAYDTEQYAQYLMRWMGNQDVMDQMSQNAGQYRGRFDERTILAQWDALVAEICKDVV